jgi:hypothetical protein
MADREIVRAPFKSEFPNITDAGFRYLQQIAEAINLIRGGTTHGTLTDYLEIEKDGTIRFYGAATAWKDLNLDLLSLALGASSPDIGVVGAGSIKYLLFDGIATAEEVSGSIEIQHDVVLDVIKPHIHWFPTTADAGNVKWNLTYAITNVGDAEPAETTLSVTTAAPGAIQSTVSGFSDIDISGYTPGAQFSCRLFRDPTDAADTYAHDVATKTFGLHVEIQSLGTRTTIVD